MFTLRCNLLKKKSIVMKTVEKTSLDGIAQVVFRLSTERCGHYLCHYGRLAPDGTFVEDFELSLSEFLDRVGVLFELVTAFMKDLSDSEQEILKFGYLSQERFDSFMRLFVNSCDAVVLYPGMLVLSFNRKEDEGR